MTWANVPATAFVDGLGVLPSFALNYWKTAIAGSLDGVGGSGGTPYAPITQLGIGGAGLLLVGNTALELDSTSICKQDASGIFNWFGTQNLKNGGLVNVNGGGVISLVGTSGLQQAELYVGAFGIIFVDNNGQILIESGGLFNVASGGLSKVSAGAFLQLYGIQAVESGAIVDVLTGGSVTVESGGQIKVKSGGALVTDSGSTANLAGATNLQGTTTQSGKYIKAGTTGYTVERQTTINATGGAHTISSPWDYDTIMLNGNGPADSVSLGAPSGIPDGVRVRLRANNGSWTVSGLASPASEVLTSTGAQRACLEIETSGGAWDVASFVQGS